MKLYMVTGGNIAVGVKHDRRLQTTMRCKRNQQYGIDGGPLNAQSADIIIRIMAVHPSAIVAILC